jgi:hypothetical protein
MAMISFQGINDKILFARQSMSSDFFNKSLKTRDILHKVFSFLKIDAWLLTRNNMMINKDEFISSIVFCFENISTLFVNHEHKYILYFDPINGCRYVLIDRYLQRMFPSYSVYNVELTNHNIEGIEPWLYCAWFILITNRYEHEHKDIVLNALKEESKDTCFIKTFYECCLETISTCKGWSFVNERQATKRQNNMPAINNILGFLYEIVQIYCKVIDSDERERCTMLYNKLPPTSQFQSIKRHITISKRMASETITKLYHMLEYELKINSWSSQMIQRTHLNMTHCIVTHYKYLIHVYTDVLKNNNTDSPLTKYSFQFIEFIEQHNDTLKNINKLADTMNDLVQKGLIAP